MPILPNAAYHGGPVDQAVYPGSSSKTWGYLLLCGLFCPLAGNQSAPLLDHRVAWAIRQMDLVENDETSIHDTKPVRGIAGLTLLGGYVLITLGTLPFGLTCWNGFLKDTLGRFLSIEAIHLIQYAGLGILAAFTLKSLPSPRGRSILVGLVAAVGLLDESIQSLLPGRFFQWSDVALNWIGAWLGFAVCLTMKKKGSLRRLLDRPAGSDEPVPTEEKIGLLGQRLNVS